jgi:enoyl-CoA hydratase
MLDIDEQPDLITVTMTHGAVNAQDIELLRALSQTFRSRANDPRPIVITGQGRTFSAGVDLKRLLDGGPYYVEEFLPALSEAFLAIFEHPAPVVAAVNGHALAGGFIIVAACDARVGVAGRATLGVTELLVGVPFPPVPLEIVRFAVGDPVAADLIYTGRRMDVEECRRIGLLAEVVEDAETLLPAAAARARQMGAVQQPAFAISKRQLRRDTVERIARRRLEDDAQVTAVWAHPATLAAIGGYLDSIKRP